MTNYNDKRKALRKAFNSRASSPLSGFTVAEEGSEARFIERARDSIYLILGMAPPTWESRSLMEDESRKLPLPPSTERHREKIMTEAARRISAYYEVSLKEARKTLGMRYIDAIRYLNREASPVSGYRNTSSPEMGESLWKEALGFQGLRTSKGELITQNDILRLINLENQRIHLLASIYHLERIRAEDSRYEDHTLALVPKEEASSREKTMKWIEMALDHYKTEATECRKAIEELLLPDPPLSGFPLTPETAGGSEDKTGPSLLSSPREMFVWIRDNITGERSFDVPVLYELLDEKTRAISLRERW